MKLISPAIHSAVTKALKTANDRGATTLRVYAVAESIRAAHQGENTALEDIVDLIVAQSGPAVALEVDAADAKAAVMGVMECAHPHLLRGA
jgi:hypothetical protein